MASYTRERCQLPFLLLKAGLKQSDLARITGIHARVISHYCNDTRKIELDDLYTIWMALREYLPDLQMHELYTWREKKTK